MKELYEKRSVEKDGLPEKPGRYFAFARFDTGEANTEYMVHVTFNGKSFDWERVTHYLLPVSTPSAQEAIEFAEWISELAAYRVSTEYPDGKIVYGKWFVRFKAPNKDPGNYKTTAELYDLFKSETSK